MKMFESRQDAGRKLIKELGSLAKDKEVIVAGLARGGVVVANEIAQHFSWPLDILIVRKIGAPGNEELALGAIAEEGKGVFNEELITLLGVSKEYLQKEAERQKELIRSWKDKYLKGYTPLSYNNKTVILVDDGIATGASMRVAINAVRNRGAREVIIAVPVSARGAQDALNQEVDKLICLSVPVVFQAVGFFYKNFEQVSDDEVATLILG